MENLKMTLLKQRSLGLLLIFTLMMGLMFAAPSVNGRAWAAEGEEVASEEEINPDGPGMAILMVGLAMVSVVGLVYIGQSRSGQAKDPEA